MSFALISYARCPNTDIKSKSDRGLWYVKKWAAIYLKDAQTRLAPQMQGYDLTIEDIYALQQMCAYEVSILRSLVIPFSLTAPALSDCRNRLLQILRAIH